MAKKLTLIVAAVVAVLYLGAIAAGLRVKSFSFLSLESTKEKTAWKPPHLIPTGALGDSIRRGELIFNETPLYAAQYTPSKVSCASCHAEGGIQPYASPMVGLPAKFPMFNARAGHVISLKDRVQECFVRSENGHPLAYDGEEMSAIVNYIDWLSQKPKTMKPFVGRGLIELPALNPDTTRGQAIYAEQCSGCHGNNGQGKAPKFPPLWGPDSFNDGAGMHSIPKMAAFVQHNMPQNRMGILTPQQAYDVSAYIHSQQRPAFNQAYKHF